MSYSNSDYNSNSLPIDILVDILLEAKMDNGMGFNMYDFLGRLHEDPKFRYGFELEPEQCLNEYQISPEIKRLLATREQAYWFSSETGPQMLALLTIPMIVMVTLNLIPGTAMRGKKLSDIIEL